MSMPLWLEIAIGILVGIIFIAVLGFIVSALVYAVAGEHIQRSGRQMIRSGIPSIQQALYPPTTR